MFDSIEKVLKELELEGVVDEEFTSNVRLLVKMFLQEQKEANDLSIKSLKLECLLHSIDLYMLNATSSAVGAIYGHARKEGQKAADEYEKKLIGKDT